LVANPRQQAVATPVITAPPDMTLSSCRVPDIGMAEASDVCHARPVAISNDAPARFTVGRNVVTWSAADGIDPAVSAQQIVTIEAADRIAPTLSCTIVKADLFQVAAVDDCDGPTRLQLGSYRVASGEVIKVTEAGKPGVRLLGTAGDDSVRHFQVGKGGAVITGTDAAGNIARAVCGIVTEIGPRRAPND
jgi:hypothetical protein